MPDTKTNKSKTINAEEEQLKDMDNREEGRLSDEQDVQQDLNQGMDTGTHDSPRRGINWGSSYHAPAAAPREKSSKPASTVAPKSANRRDNKK
jgi:hypothetical protein